jgi:hypothetical protein
LATLALDEGYGLAARRMRDWGMDYEDALHDAVILLLCRQEKTAGWDARSVRGWLVATSRRMTQGARRQGLQRSAMVLHESMVAAVPKTLDKQVDEKREAQRAWAALTQAERRAFTVLHILEEDIRHADCGVFSRRVRMAKRRLGAHGHKEAV